MAWHAAVYAGVASGFYRFGAFTPHPPAEISALIATPAVAVGGYYLSRVHIQRMLLSQ